METRGNRSCVKHLWHTCNGSGLKLLFQQRKTGNQDFNFLFPVTGCVSIPRDIISRVRRQQLFWGKSWILWVLRVGCIPWHLLHGEGFVVCSYHTGSLSRSEHKTVVDLLPQPFYTQEMTHELMWGSRENISPDSFRHVWIFHPRSDKVHGQQYKSVSPTIPFVVKIKLSFSLVSIFLH